MPSTACDQCYRRKTGCAGERPVCNRCTVAGLTCTYSTGRPVGKPKGHRKSKSCNATISQSASPGQGSPPIPLIHETAFGPGADNAHTTANTASHGGIIESPASRGTGSSTEPPFSSGFPSNSSGGDPLFNASPGNISQPSRSTASPYEHPMTQPVPGEEGYFCPNTLPRNGWIDPVGTPTWPMQTITTALMSGPIASVAEIPAFSMEAGVDHHWLQPASMAPISPSFVMQGTGVTLSCQCSMLLDDIASLFRCQVSLPRANFDQVLQVVQQAIQKGQSSLDCYGCAVHGWSGVFTNAIVMLQQAAVCLQAILAVIDNDPSLTAGFGSPHGINGESYHLDSKQLKRRVVHAVVERELDGMQHLAQAVRTTAQVEYASVDAHPGIMPLLAALDESLEALRRSVLTPPHT